MIIRWVCKNCNRKWIYPVGKCIYCKKDVEEKIRKKLKIVGITNVNVASVSHPIVPYNILMLEDEDGDRIPKKTIKDYKIGDFYEEKPASSENAVSIVKIKYDLDKAVEEALYLVNDLNVNKSSKILIKPNMITAARSYLGITTNSKTISAVIKYLIKKGAKKENIILAEQCLYSSFDDGMKKTGLGLLAKNYGINFIDIAKSEFVEKKFQDFKVKITKKIFEMDLIINVPVLKTHLVLGICGAFENMVRTIAPEDLSRIDKLVKEGKVDLHEAIVKLHKMLPKYFTVGDGSVGMEGNGPLNGVPAYLDYILASNDPVAHDTVFQELGLFIQKPKYLEIANKVGLGECNIEKIEVAGNELMATARELRTAVGSRLINQS